MIFESDTFYCNLVNFSEGNRSYCGLNLVTEVGLESRTCSRIPTWRTPGGPVCYRVHCERTLSTFRDHVLRTPCLRRLRLITCLSVCLSLIVFVTYMNDYSHSGRRYLTSRALMVNETPLVLTVLPGRKAYQTICSTYLLCFIVIIMWGIFKLVRSKNVSRMTKNCPWRPYQRLPYWLVTQAIHAASFLVFCASVWKLHAMDSRPHS